MASIDDLVAKAEHSKHAKKAKRIQEAVMRQAHVSYLKHYKNSLSKDDRKEFDDKSETEQLDIMAEKDFKLKEHAADDYLRGITYAAIRAVSPTKSKDLKKHLDVLKKEDAKPDEIAAALQEIEQYQAMLIPYGIDMSKLKAAGAEQGFNSELIQQVFKEFGKRWLAKTQKSYLDQIKEPELDKYIGNAAQEEEFRHMNKDVVNRLPYDQKREFVLGHRNAKKMKAQGGVQDFLEDYKNYFHTKAA